MTALRYRPCVGLCIFNADGKVFVGQRIDKLGGEAWQMPQGGIDEGEDIVAAALREMLEEIGTNNAEIIRIHDTPLRYDLPEEIRRRVSWGDVYAGQEQIWVALRFKGEDGDIKLDAWEHPEFSRFQWVDLTEVPNLIVPFKVDIYKKVVAAFGDIR
ncbi:MAG: RNA pyrophosphohydrolase [Micavibrio aeruginosavorus]|uniref:RNA pyrophosphohydrolase n=1 Tax=Micavibrio aeruginosavorus TaxID=349221 RepID=A0A2W4ZRI7_9BACT|nr:MAG: RNA pyrophosphohydrolase [Micavibrio aeruginosavorus]